jgi:hypothetical protein
MDKQMKRLTGDHLAAGNISVRRLGEVLNPGVARVPLA